MLPEANRLRDKQGFSLAFRRGAKAGNQDLVVYQYTDQQSTQSPLVGLVVPKKAMKRAVHRNRTKRQLRHLMRERLDQLPQGSITVVRVLRSMVDLNYEALAQSLDNDLRRVAKKSNRTREQVGDR